MAPIKRHTYKKYQIDDAEIWASIAIKKEIPDNIVKGLLMGYSDIAMTTPPIFIKSEICAFW